VPDIDIAHISVTVAEYQGMLPEREDGFTGRIPISSKNIQVSNDKP
jgi:hypothetical protein